MYKYFIASFSLLFSFQIYADTFQGKVVGISDGDTITVLDISNTQHKVRLSGIDAPEKKQPFGQVSKKSLSDLVYGKVVLVDWSKKDRYGRTIGKVLINDVDVNLEQLKRGLAWHYKAYQNEQLSEDRLTYAKAEEEASQNKQGLWIEPMPVAPWDWRKRMR